MKKANLLIYVLIAFTLIFGACNSKNSNKKTTKSDSEKVIIGYPHLRISLPVIVAYDRGYFEDEGLDVTLKSYVTAQPMMDAIVTGKINMGGFCALPITFGAMARSNQELLFLGGMYEDDDYPISELIVKDTANITSVKDLEGKRIGILPTRAYEVWIQDILTKNQVSLDKVTISYVKPNMQANALNSGTVDALFTNDPAATIVKAKGIGFKIENGLVPSTTNISPFYFGSFNIRKDFASNNQATVAKVSKAINLAIYYINENQDEAKSIMAKTDKKTGIPYLPESFHDIVDKFPNSNFHKTNETSESELIELKEYYLKKGILPKNISLIGLQYSN